MVWYFNLNILYEKNTILASRFGEKASDVALTSVFP